MTILTTIANQKLHIIYGIIIILVGSLAYHFFKKDPAIITKTLTKVITKVQTVEKVVTKDKVVYVTRTITTHKKDGDVVVEVDHEKDTSQVHADTKSKDITKSTVTQKTVETFLKNYSIEAFFPTNSFTPTGGTYMMGMRVFTLPVFVEVGTTGHFNQALVGLRLEF